MLTRSELEQIVDVCKTIGNEASDEAGFIPIRSLLNRFHATLLLRPLLVEGMLASMEQKSDSALGETRWAILIDSETYQIDRSELDSESEGDPLPNRFRNTVAHELLHSLAFRPTEFGVRLKVKPDDDEHFEKFTREIEIETERLSPLLLWSGKALARLLKGRKESLSVDELVDVGKAMGMSRVVLINRLRMIGPTDSDRLWHSPGLQNIAIGIAEWTVGGTAAIRGWPLFASFERNFIPSFLLKIGRQDRSPATTFCHDASFAMCGGQNRDVNILVDAGTSVVPSATRMTVNIAIEDASRKPGTEFLFVVRKQD